MPAVCPQEWTSAENTSAFACCVKNRSACVVLEQGGIWSQLVKMSLLHYCVRVFPCLQVGFGGRNQGK